ncbi:MAG: glutamate-5-semialdehyde dehydrogenase [Oscillospiraceae bacterium]|nr:glutamate-5-semialdehyde dehydrogenase [Oscillospiraceae bacterium]MBQ7118740.1 glutamate-5-semialdehyde dehydrogenase [Oscillospiraceae bacterium]
MTEYLKNIGERAVAASRSLNLLSDEDKNRGLVAAAKALVEKSGKITEANATDVANAERSGMSPALIDRLRLDDKRIKAMSEGLLQISELSSPLGEIVFETERPNGLKISQVRVPVGVIGIIYESRPNVTADAFGLCFKTGNAVVLRGGSDAINSNIAISDCIREALSECGICEDAIQLLGDTSRETAKEMMRLNGYIDVLIPRGGAGLIKTVVETSTLPVIETGTGNCHIYVDEYADIFKACKIVENAKTQRLGVCNACESLVVHSTVAETAVTEICKILFRHGVEVRGDERAREVLPEIKEASESDWGEEYLDKIISLKIVDSIDEAITHINKYNTKHSEAIITENPDNAEKFLNGIDAAAVYVNASTRFTDGFEFGFGAEIGISTQKLHARGPMGLRELTSTKYIIIGNGQIRG